MLALAEIAPSDWIGFIAVILVFLALDLGVFHRHARVVTFREAASWTARWVFVTMLFGLLVAPKFVEGWSRSDTVEFITGYVVELSLSMDNVFVIALIFAYFRVPLHLQHRVLSGAFSAPCLCGSHDLAGDRTHQAIQLMLYVLGGFLV
jgi:tellurite resistance protein TerC